MPRAVQYLTTINPLRYAIDITRRVYLEGAGLDLLGSDLWPLALLAALTLTAAAWMFSNRMQ
jgi:ABC-2 type transport system permease protein